MNIWTNYQWNNLKVNIVFFWATTAHQKRIKHQNVYLLANYFINDNKFSLLNLAHKKKIFWCLKANRECDAYLNLLGTANCQSSDEKLSFFHTSTWISWLNHCVITRIWLPSVVLWETSVANETFVRTFLFLRIPANELSCIVGLLVHKN